MLELFTSLHAAGRTVVLITHDPGVAATAQRQIRLLDGQVVAGPADSSQVAAAALVTQVPDQGPAGAWAP